MLAYYMYAYYIKIRFLVKALLPSDNGHSWFFVVTRGLYRHGCRILHP